MLGLERLGRPLPQPPAALGQPQLQQQKLIEHQPATAGLQGRAVSGLVDALQCLSQREQRQPAAQLRRQGIRPALQGRQHPLQRPAQGVGAEALGERIDRHQPPDGLGAHRRPRPLQHLQQRIVESRPPGALLHQSAHRHGGPGGELPLLGLEPAGGGEATSGEEAAHPQPAGHVLEVEFQDRQVGVAGAGEGVAAAHGGHHRGGATGFQGADPHQVGVIEVVAGVVAHQIPHQQQPQSGEPGGSAGTDAAHLPQGRGGSRAVAGVVVAAEATAAGSARRRRGGATGSGGRNATRS